MTRIDNGDEVLKDFNGYLRIERKLDRTTQLEHIRKAKRLIKFVGGRN